MRPYIFKYMDQQDLQQLHKDLVARKEQLEAEMSQVANPNPAVEGDSEVKTHTSNNSGDEDEYAHNVADLSTNFAIQEQLENELEEVKKAIQKIEEGKYGKCEKCSKDIQPARLKLVPVASLCVDCISKD